ncbi:MAG: hypothetical protein KDD46_04590 [Bdellovibrionales bacterium]|nr:hypothetical protein [Bdellovibrionales bacterium]
MVIHEKVPFVSSQSATVKARGYVELEVDGSDKKYLFQTFVRYPDQIYLEFKELGIIGLIYNFSHDTATIVVPKEKRVLVSHSPYPIELWHKSKLTKDLFFAALLYRFEDIFKKSVLLQKDDTYSIYHVKDMGDFFIGHQSGRISHIKLDNQIEIYFTKWNDNQDFPIQIDIIEGNNSLRWVWKYWEEVESISDDIFEIEIPKDYIVQSKS